MKLTVCLLTAACAMTLSCSCQRNAEASNTQPKSEAKPPATPVVPSAKAVIEPAPATPDVTATPPSPMPKRKPYQPETEEQLRERLSELEYEVTRNAATERPWTNKYDEHFEEGIYVCIISGEPLFSSKDKYDSGCGWPAFTKPIDKSEIAETTDFKIGYPRTEVRAKTGNSHLGHVFPDGPPDKGGLRYCINSASLRFVPKTKLVEEGYGEYVKMFEGGDS